MARAYPAWRDLFIRSAHRDENRFILVPVKRVQLEDRLRERYLELQETVGPAFPPRMRETVIMRMLRDEATAEAGADPALAEALDLVRKHGLREARRLAGEGELLAWKEDAGMDMKRERRVAAYLHQWYTALPWWKRIFA
jgi:hypothetical protein